MGNMIYAATTKSSGSGNYTFLFVIVAVLVLMYFVMIRPQRRRQQHVMQTQRELVPGNRVRTKAGMYATIVAVDGDDVILEVAPGVEMRFVRRAIMEVLPDGGGAGPFGGAESDEYSEPGEYSSDEADEPGEEAEHPGEVRAQTGDGEASTVADTLSEAETTDEAGAAPSGNGKNPADEGRPAGR
jgi:preprotein translocase YajC subunit